MQLLSQVQLCAGRLRNLLCLGVLLLLTLLLPTLGANGRRQLRPCHIWLLRLCNQPAPGLVILQMKIGCVQRIHLALQLCLL